MRGLLLFLAFLVPGAAGAASTEALKGLLEQTTTARARFAQIVLDKNLKVLQQATGSMQFSRPGKFRWEYDKPYEQVIVSDGSRVWLYDKDLNQVTVRKLDRALGSSPALCSQAATRYRRAIRSPASAARMDSIGLRRCRGRRTLHSRRSGWVSANRDWRLWSCATS